MARMRPRLAAPMLIAVGAAFDFHAGLVAQAPPWMGRHGLEWAYRLAREPRRLWRRYARYNPRFVAAFARQYAAERRRQPPTLVSCHGFGAAIAACAPPAAGRRPRRRGCRVYLLPHGLRVRPAVPDARDRQTPPRGGGKPAVAA